MNLTFKYVPFKRHDHPALVLIIVGTMFYHQTINNGFALEDNGVSHSNTHVIKGVKRLKDILLKDYVDKGYRVVLLGRFY